MKKFMKKVRRFVKKVVRLVKNIDWSNVVKVFGGMVCVAGLFVIIGSAGNSDLNLVSFKETVITAFSGLAMLVGGALVIELLDSHSEEDEVSDIEEELIGAMAYNRKYRSWMTVVYYNNDEDWAFVLCSNSGRPTSAPIRTRRNLLNYKWTV